MRGVSEVVAAAALLAASMVVALMVWQLVLPKAKLLEPPKARMLARINDTHALCRALETIPVQDLVDAGVRVWVFGDVDGDGWLEPIPVARGTIHGGELYLASPPICYP